MMRGEGEGGCGIGGRSGLWHAQRDLNELEELTLRARIADERKARGRRA